MTQSKVAKPQYYKEISHLVFLHRAALSQLQIVAHREYLGKASNGAGNFSADF